MIGALFRMDFDNSVMHCMLLLWMLDVETVDDAHVDDAC